MFVPSSRYFRLYFHSEFKPENAVKNRLSLKQGIWNPGIGESGNLGIGEAGIRESGNPGIGESGNRGIRESITDNYKTGILVYLLEHALATVYNANQLS